MRGSTVHVETKAWNMQLHRPMKLKLERWMGYAPIICGVVCCEVIILCHRLNGGRVFLFSLSKKI